MIRIAAVGRIKEKWMREGIADYLKRIQPYEKTEIIEVEDEKAPESNSDAENEKVKTTEGSKLLKQIRDTDYVVLLDLAGCGIHDFCLNRIDLIESMCTDPEYHTVNLIFNIAFSIQHLILWT